MTSRTARNIHHGFGTAIIPESSANLPLGLLPACPLLAPNLRLRLRDSYSCFHPIRFPEWNSRCCLAKSPAFVLRRADEFLSSNPTLQPRPSKILNSIFSAACWSSLVCERLAPASYGLVRWPWCKALFPSGPILLVFRLLPLKAGQAISGRSSIGVSFGVRF